MLLEVHIRESKSNPINQTVARFTGRAKNSKAKNRGGDEEDGLVHVKKNVRLTCRPMCDVMNAAYNVKPVCPRLDLGKCTCAADCST